MTEYDPNSLEPTRALEIKEGGVKLTLYGQDDVLISMPVKDTRFNRQLAVYLRKFDRQAKHPEVTAWRERV